jgi:calcineurin-like phosphoesterase family protein
MSELAGFIVSYSFVVLLWAESRSVFGHSAAQISKKTKISVFETVEIVGMKPASKGHARASSNGAGVGAWSWLSK